MKRYRYIIYCLLTSLAVMVACGLKSQPDLLIDKCYTMQTLQVVYKTYTVQDSLNWSDPFIHGCQRVGTHAYLLFGTEVANTGTEDFSLGDIYCGLAFCHPEFFYHDPVHGHVHQRDFFDIKLRKLSCGDIITGKKLSFAFVDYQRYANGTVNGHYINLLDACQAEWLSENNVLIDSAWAYLQPNDNFNSNSPGITRGFADLYGAFTECNSLIITGAESGYYNFSIGINPPSYTNEGGNAPNYMDFDFYLSMEDTAVYDIGEPVDCCPPACYCENAGIVPQVPVNIVADEATKTVTWESIDTPCHYWVNRYYAVRHRGGYAIFPPEWGGAIYGNSFTDVHLETGAALQAKIAFYASLYGIKVKDNTRKGYVFYTVSAINGYDNFSLQSAESARSNFIQP